MFYFSCNHNIFIVFFSELNEIKESLADMNKKIKHISAQCRNPRMRIIKNENWPMASSVLTIDKDYLNNMHCIEENGEGRAEGEERQRMPAAP
jgi:hypothetical protein